MMKETVYKELLNDFLPVFRKFAGTEKYSITLAGSRGKGMADEKSDFDFGIFVEKVAEREVRKQAYKEINRLKEKWEKRGMVVDDVWPRTYAEVEEQMEPWFNGQGEPEKYVWTIWGYHILPSIFNQQIIEDPHGRVAKWKEQLAIYPEVLKESIIKKHGSSLNYWRNDYHYRNKVYRKDVVFLSSLTARLIHDMLQVIYALNEFYYPGDGMNLKYTEQFDCKPEKFEERVVDVLHLSESDDAYEIQYRKMMKVMDDVLILAKKCLHI